MERQQEIIENEQSNSSVSMSEILDDELQLEEEAADQASQNWGNEEECTHGKGYIHQAVFACETCYDTTKNPSAKQFGFCYGCSMNCHLHHNVIELFEKRAFKCDCGTPRSHSDCAFDPQHVKTEDNDKNQYNHNFDGLYCWCDGPYSCSDMVMYQCVACMDWFHQECIKGKEENISIPEADVPCDFVCCDCVGRLDFLKKYPHLQLKASTTSSKVDLKASTKEEETVDVEKVDQVEAAKEGNKEEMKEENKEEIKNECKLKSLENEKQEKIGSNIFFEKKWRFQLCECKECLELYQSLNVSYLVTDREDEEADEKSDTEEREEERPNRKRPHSILDINSNPLIQAIPHQQKVNVITGFNDMVSGLKDYLKVFAETGKEVSKQDIDTFFEGLKRRKIS